METNMERNQDNGRGMFYAIIGVATLVITIIGATFAYLTATTNSAENTVTATGATITLGYTDVKTGLKQNLIPIDPALTQFNKGTHTGLNVEKTESVTYNFVGIDHNDCRDVNGNNICSVYEFTISNPGTNTVSQYVYASLSINENTFTNMKYAVFKGKDSEITASEKGWDVDGAIVSSLTTDYENTQDANYQWTKTAADATRKHTVANKGDLVVTQVDLTKDQKVTHQLSPLNQYLDIGESMTYTIVLWVDETGSAQDADQGKSFKATVKFTTEGNSTGVTGDLDASS